MADEGEPGRRTSATDPPGGVAASGSGEPTPPPATGRVRVVPGGRGRGRARRVLVAGGRSLTILVSVTALVVTGVAWVMVDRIQEDLSTTSVLADLRRAPVEAERNAPPPPDAADLATDILLVGNDSRTDAQGRPLPESVLRELRTEANAGLNTDTIILLRIPDDGSAAHAVSIPRDTSVPVSALGTEEKINGAFGLVKARKANELAAQGVTDRSRIERESDHAGRLALVRAVQDLTGAHIDHYAEVNLYGFYLFTEAIGGVEVCLNQATSDTDSGASFTRGAQVISGGDALAFVRQRKNLPRGDLDRIVRQQVFLAALANKVLSTGTLTDPGKLQALLAATRDSVVLDEDLDLVGFARQLEGIASGAIQFTTIPVTGVGARNDRGQSIITVDPTQVRDFVAGLLDGVEDPPAPARSSGPGTPAPGAPSEAQETGAPSAGPAAAGGPSRPAEASSLAAGAPTDEDPITAEGLTCVN